MDDLMRLGCITGMHRSGTSAAARLLGLVGADLGPAENFLDTRPDNPMGYFENRDITRLNDAVLRHLGSSWDNPPRLPDGWEAGSEFDEFRFQGRRIVEETFGVSAPAACKDPRLSITLPLWRTMVDIDAVVLMVRHPVQVAASLAVRDGMSSERACALWTRYTASGWINGREPMVVAFDDLMARTAEVGKNFAALFAVCGGPETIDGLVDGAVDRRLRNHDGVVGELGPEMELATRLYDSLIGSDSSSSNSLCEELWERWS